MFNFMIDKDKQATCGFFHCVKAIDNGTKFSLSKVVLL